MENDPNNLNEADRVAEEVKAELGLGENAAETVLLNGEEMPAGEEVTAEMLAARERAAAEKKKKKKMLIFGAVGVGVLVIIGLVLCYVFGVFGTNYSRYVTLGQYKGIEVTPIPVSVTQEQVDAKIEENLNAAATFEPVDRAAILGDTVTLSCTAVYADTKEEFPNGTVTDTDLKLGSGSFVKGFEAALVGIKAGETREVPITFDEDYGREELVGVSVIFTVNVSAVKEYVVPELDEAFLAANTVYSTVEEYRESVYAGLLEEAQAAAFSQRVQEAWAKVVNNCKVSDYPEELVEMYRKDYLSYYEQYAAYYGTTLEEYLASAYNTTLEDFNAEVTSAAKEDAATVMIASCILRAEGKVINEAEYKEGVLGYLTQSGFTEETYQQQYGKTFEEEYGRDFLYAQLTCKKAMTLVGEAAVDIGQ